MIEGGTPTCCGGGDSQYCTGSGVQFDHLTAYDNFDPVRMVEQPVLSV